MEVGEATPQTHGGRWETSEADWCSPFLSSGQRLKGFSSRGESSEIRRLLDEVADHLRNFQGSWHYLRKKMFTTQVWFHISLLEDMEYRTGNRWQTGQRSTGSHYPDQQSWVKRPWFWLRWTKKEMSCDPAKKPPNSHPRLQEDASSTKSLASRRGCCISPCRFLAA